MRPAIEVQNLTKIFHKNHHPKVVLDQVSFRVEPGEFVLLKGPNGAGKTTLLKILATLILPNHGDARVFGWDCARHVKPIKKRVGLMSGDERSLYWRLTGRQNLEFFGGLFGLSKKARRKKIAELQELFGLSFLNQRVQECSSGMKQRLVLARALMHSPDLLLLDEPTKGLDQESQGVFLNYLQKDLSEQQRKTVIMVTHSAQKPGDYADRTFFLENGRLTT